ncbi:hypothetical protein J6590_037216 [Homalodisca vitripennis]|nr:hypothetical protein J6590_037216 [Homalodisca vitripennis]
MWRYGNTASPTAYLRTNVRSGNGNIDDSTRYDLTTYVACSHHEVQYVQSCALLP